jgi:3-methylcrotonyl-CoA carboxylase alpha subunit
VTPSFPATVAKVLVEVGEVVDQGQPLVVVSSMKTEMTLSAPRKGRVAAVAVEAGAQVSPGDVLVEIDDGGSEDHG